MIARVAAILIVTAAALFAIDKACVEPLRCARAAHRESAAELSTCACGASNVEVCTAKATLLAVGGDAKSAVAMWREALEVDRRPEIYFALGMDALDAFDRRAGVEALAWACSFDPRRLKDIPYDDVRSEVTQRIVAGRGRDWIR